MLDNLPKLNRKDFQTCRRRIEDATYRERSHLFEIGSSRLSVHTGIGQSLRKICDMAYLLPVRSADFRIPLGEFVQELRDFCDISVRRGSQRGGF